MSHTPEFILCELCSTPTCVPPEELIQYKGKCISCVMKLEVLPLIRDVKGEALAGLVEAILEQAKSATDLDDVVPTGGMAIVLGGPAAGLQPHHVDRVIKAFQQALVCDPKVREAMQNILNTIEKESPKAEGGRPDKPVVHNDPRFS